MWVLEHCPSHIQLINSPTGIRTVNEKIWTTQFKSIIPKTWVTSSIKELKSLLSNEKQLILKPTDGFGGQSIYKVTNNDCNKNVIFETMTKNNTQYVIAQTHLDEAKDGDKRILLWQGEPLGAILRKHSSSDHRNNFFSGGTAQPATITKQDKHIISILKPKLKELNLQFVGIDIIGDYLIEVNVTSPTCLQELNKLSNKSYHIEIMNKVINKNINDTPNIDKINQ